MPYPLAACRAAGVLGGGAAPVTYSISGTVAYGATNIAGVTVTLGAHSAMTAADGTFTLSSLPAGTSGALTPSKTDHTFAPATITIAAMSGNLTAQNFSGFSPSLLSDVLWLRADKGLYKEAAKAQPVTADADAVYTLADQSGGGLDAIQATAGARPIYKVNILNTKPCLLADGVNTVITFPYPLGANTDFTVFLVNVENTLAYHDKWNFANGESAYGKAWTIDSNPNQTIIVVTDSVANGLTVALGPSQLVAGRWNIIRVRKNGTSNGNLTLYNKGVYCGVNAGKTAGNPVSCAVDMMKATTDGYFAEELVFARALTDAECQDIENRWLGRWFTRRIVCDGNSLTWGTGATTVNGYPTADYPNQLYALYNQPINVLSNLGVGGQTTAQMIADAATKIDVLVGNAWAKPIVVCWEGTNDIAIGGLDGVAAYANIVTYCQGRRAAGFKVVVCNIMARNQASPFETRRLVANALIAANWATFADVLVDIAGTASLSNYSDTTYFSADGVHLNDTGYGVVAALVKAAIDTL